jgi:putative ABC transport system substrate-binding protein
VIDRRVFLGTLAGGLLAAPLAAEAQQAGSVQRIGFLYFGSRESALDTGRYAAFVEGMRELGYVAGKNVVVEERFADGKPERLPDLVAEVLRFKPDVIVATGTPVYSALRQATATVAVVITVTADPVGEGFAVSLARPGRNITGLSTAGSDIFPKQIELLVACIPKLARITALWNSANPSHPARLREIQVVARNVGIDVIGMEARAADGIQRRFASIGRAQTGAVVILPDGFFVQQLRQLTQLALKHRLPSIAEVRQYAELGGFMTYGQNITDTFRRAAHYVDKILKGAKPGDLPIEQPTKFELLVNLKTAKALGLTIPPSLLQRADQVIE